MKYPVVRGFGLLWAAMLLVAGCGASRDASAPGSSSTAAELSLPQFSAAVARGEAVLVDVREEREVIQGMAAQAVWMPESRTQDGDSAWEAFVAGLPRDQPVGIYCRSGRRSGIAVERLRARGIAATNLGGFGDWAAEGLPVKTPRGSELVVGK